MKQRGFSVITHHNALTAARSSIICSSLWPRHKASGGAILLSFVSTAHQPNAGRATMFVARYDAFVIKQFSSIRCSERRAIYEFLSFCLFGGRCDRPSTEEEETSTPRGNKKKQDYTRPIHEALGMQDCATLHTRARNKRGRETASVVLAPS